MRVLHHIVLGLVLMTVGVGCEHIGQFTSSFSSETAPEPLPVPADVKPCRVYVADVTISPAVVIPPEMEEVGSAGLTELAQQHLEFQLGRNPSAFVVIDRNHITPGSGDETLPVTAVISRLALSGTYEEALYTVFGKKIYNEGDVATVSRKLILDVQYRVVRPDGTIFIVGSGSAAHRIEISGTVSYDLAYGGAKAGAKGSLKDARVDRSSLAPAFELASAEGASELAKALCDRSQRQQVLAEQAARPQHDVTQSNPSAVVR